MIPVPLATFCLFHSGEWQDAKGVDFMVMTFIREKSGGCRRLLLCLMLAVIIAAGWVGAGHGEAGLPIQREVFRGLVRQQERPAHL